MSKITWEIAARLRTSPATQIPLANADAYEDIRLRDIALRQRELLEELKRLDDEVFQNARCSIAKAGARP